MVERARTEADGDGGGEDAGRQLTAWAVGAEDQKGAGDE
jgi:hypothetical protein